MHSLIDHSIASKIKLTNIVNFNQGDNHGSSKSNIIEDEGATLPSFDSCT